MAAAGRALAWSQLHEAVRQRRWRIAALRPLVCAVIAIPFLILAAVQPSWFTVALPVMPLVVFIAFLREAQRNVRGDLLVLRGRVIQCGGTWDTDAGGVLEAPANRVVYVWRVTLDVREAWSVDRAGARTPAPARRGRFEIDQPWWVKQVELGEEVALLCLPASTDPLLKLDLAALDASAPGAGATAASGAGGAP